jgi:hypothetical protein
VAVGSRLGLLGRDGRFDRVAIGTLDALVLLNKCVDLAALANRDFAIGDGVLVDPKERIYVVDCTTSFARPSEKGHLEGGQKRKGGGGAASLINALLLDGGELLDLGSDILDLFVRHFELELLYSGLDLLVLHQ